MKRVVLATISVVYLAYAQNPEKDIATFRDYKPGYYENAILKGIEQFEQKQTSPKPAPRRFKVELSGKTLPTDPGKYTKIWHNQPVSQGNTNTCWCYSTTSFFESEVKRIAGKEVKLSEMYPVYWEYVERAKYFVQHRGDMSIGEGSEANAVKRSYAMYGIVPYSAYTGLKPGQPFHTHEEMFSEIKAFLEKVRADGIWNEDYVVSTVKSILNYHMGEPPASVVVDGKSMSPMQYMKEYCRLDMTAYLDLMSMASDPYWKQAEYRVPDNWWHDATYWNIPLDDYMQSIKTAVKNGFTIAIGGDVSESGLVTDYQVAVVPTYDIPSSFIDENARIMRFLNGSTTDDHGMHIVGYQEFNGKTWFLVKDSGAGSRLCGEGNACFGYYFFHEDYIKLKMMSLIVHKDAVKELTTKFK